MRSLEDIGALLEAAPVDAPAKARALDFLTAGEEVLTHWLIAHGREPRPGKSEGFRLLGLHRQAAKGDPSFNACRETCRELVFHYNLVRAANRADDSVGPMTMMRFVLNHLYLFVCGKLESAGLGEFCCAAKPIRNNPLFDTLEA